MMASHRPAETPSDQPPPPIDPSAPAQPASDTSALPPSNFLVGFDWVLSFGILALGFLIASFSVRNPDFWTHLATGRLLAQGGYSFGKDPFSFVGGDRVWVNHSWLFDWLTYVVHQAGGGPALVIVKASLVSATAGILLLARKAGQPVFASVVCVALALLASASRLMFQPVIMSYLCLAVLMFLLIRVPKPSGSWRFPLMVGVLFWFWANLDTWFVLGPAALLLYTIGQYVRPDEGEDPVTLWKALALGALACMLNPNHYRVWALPVELVDQGLASIFGKDAEFAGVFAGALDRRGLDFSGELDRLLGLVSLLMVTGASLLGFVINYKRLSASQVLMVLGFAALALVHVRAVPFFVFVAAPIAALNLADAGRRLAERPMPNQRMRLLHGLRGGGRVVVGIACVLLIAISYAGWEHLPALQRRWKWDIEPDESLKLAAEQIHTWQTEGALPADARLLNLQPDFGCYVAWYAPGARTYFDYRLRFHREEASDYVSVRRYMYYLSPQDRQQDPFPLSEFLSRNHITCLVNSSANRQNNRVALEALIGEVVPDWELWHVAGRATILGWVKQDVMSRAAFARLRFDPLRAAYTNVEPLPAPAFPLRQPVFLRSNWDLFVTAPPRAPAEGEEAYILMRYGDILIGRSEAQQSLLRYGVALATRKERLQTPALAFWSVQMTGVRFGKPPEARAVAILAVRAGRRAVAESPDHADGYYYLAEAYTAPAFSVAADTQTLMTISNYARARARLPDDPSENRTTFEVADLCKKLALAQDSVIPPNLDLRLDALRLGVSYLGAEIDVGTATLHARQGNELVQVEKQLDVKRRQLTAWEKGVKDWETEYKRNSDQYVNEAARLTSPLDRAAVARRLGLIRDAIAELHKSQEAFQKQAEEQGEKMNLSVSERAQMFAIHAELVELMMYDGRIEEAAQILDTIDTPDTQREMGTTNLRKEYARLRDRSLRIMFQGAKQRPQSRFDSDPAAHFRALRIAISLGIGDLESAAKVQITEIESASRELDQFRRQFFPKDTPKATELTDPFELFKDLFYKPTLGPITFARMDHQQHVQQYLRLVQARVDLHLRVGSTYLEQGDIDLAVHHFQQALDTHEWTKPLPAQLVAREFLKAIARARGKEAGP